MRERAAISVPEQASVAKECIHRWAYRLSRSQASTKDVVDATLGACRDAIDQVLLIGTSKSKEGALPDTIWQQFQSDFREQALFRTVQARAGRCEIN
jgi:hypothetical protein